MSLSADIAFSEQQFGRNTAFDSLADSFYTNPCPARPLRNNKSFSVNGEKNIICSIRLLLLLCGPTAIRRLVISSRIWVAINRMLWSRFLAHICDKVLERRPAFAHGYTFRPVFVISRCVRILTSLMNISPSIVFVSMRFPMRRIAINTGKPMNILVQAPA